MPLDVPIKILVVTARQVGRPKLRLPISEKACPVILFSFVHRITSQGASTSGASDSDPIGNWLVMDDCRDCRFRKAGEPDRGDPGSGEDESRVLNRCSKGR